MNPGVLDYQVLDFIGTFLFVGVVTRESLRLQRPAVASAIAWSLLHHLFIEHHSGHPSGSTVTMDHMRVRQATFDDYRAAVCVATGLYCGIDYLPAMFHEFLHSRKHRVVVMEDVRTGRIVGLAALELCEEKSFVLAFAGRIHPSLEGRGFWRTFRRLARDFSLAVEPSAKTALAVAPLSDIMHLTKIHYIWNCLLYKFFVNELPQGLCCPSRTGSGSGLGPVRRVFYAESVERLTRDDSFQDFFRQFASEFIPCNCNRRAQYISRQGLKELFAKSELFISENDSQLADNELDPKVVGVATKLSEIQAISYLSSLPVECGLVVHSFLYGFDVEELVRHVHSHLSHVGSICKGGVVAIMVQVPICIDLNSFETRLRETIGDTFRKPQERLLKTVLGSSMPYWPSTPYHRKSKL